MSLDAVVARVGAALARGHGLFSPAPLDVGPALMGSGQSLAGGPARLAGGVQMLGAGGRFGGSYAQTAGWLGDRLAAAGGADRDLGSAAGQGAGADGAGRGQSGAVLAAASGDVLRSAPLTSTPAGQQALLMALRDRVDEQRQVIEAYKRRDAQLAALVRRLRYGAGSMSPMMGSMPAGMLGGGLPGAGGGMGGPSIPNLAGMFGGRDNNSGLPGARAVADGPDAGLGAPAARAALSRLGAKYVWGAKGPSVFDCSGLTQWAWRQVGVQLGPDTYSQIGQGMAVPAGHQRAGDLIFPMDAFGEGGTPGPGHVMLAISPTEVVHAPQPGDVVKIAPMPSRFIARRPQ